MKIALLEALCESQGAGGVWQLEVNDALSHTVTGRFDVAIH